MPVQSRIYTELGLVVVRTTGTARVSEGLENFRYNLRHPDYDPRMRHLFDYAGVTGIEIDITDFVALQAELADIFAAMETPTLNVHWAPTPPGRQLAEMVRKSWEGVHPHAIRIVPTYKEACDILGLDAATRDRLRSTA